MSPASRTKRSRAALSLAGWVPGTVGAEPGKAELLSEFMLAAEHLSEEEAAEIVGVSVGTLRRWKRTPGQNLSRRARQRMLRYLARREMDCGR